MALRYLFIDFDSFYASVEQQRQPQLRERPIGVVPSIGVDTTSCIAASYEAKVHGVKTGTAVREARYLCPGIVFVEANHARYIELHHRIKALIHKIIYIEAVLSIDEMYGKLPPHWQPLPIATQKASLIKAALAKEIGPYVRASIGLAPNRFLAKLASKLEKPDGLTTLDFHEIPEKLYPFELTSITGIGVAMQRRLQTARITTMQALCQASRRKLHRIWGSIEGDRMWYALRGVDFPAAVTQRRTIGHSHVLPPRLRSLHGAHATLHRMLQKACRRLRAMDYFTGYLEVHVKFGFEIRWSTQAACFPTQDSVTLSELLHAVWSKHPKNVPNPTKVSITLSQLESRESHTPSLFEAPEQRRRVRLQKTMDQVNQHYGGRTLYYANAMEAQLCSQAAPLRIAFNHIPDLAIEGD